MCDWENEIRVDVPLPVPSELIPEDLPLSIRYEDEDMLVVDKPAGMAVHPSAGHSEHTLVHGLLARYQICRGSAASGDRGSFTASIRTPAA